MWKRGISDEGIERLKKTSASSAYIYDSGETRVEVMKSGEYWGLWIPKQGQYMDVEFYNKEDAEKAIGIILEMDELPSESQALMAILQQIRTTDDQD